MPGDPREETTTSPLLTAFYAAVAAIADGHIAEAEVARTSTIGEAEEQIIITVRRDVQPVEALPPEA